MVLAIVLSLVIALLGACILASSQDAYIIGRWDPTGLVFGTFILGLSPLPIYWALY